jgi:putative FmdB family regulatory protein
MPFYTFKCDSCGEVFETRCTIKEKEDNMVACPACGKNGLERVFSSFSVSVKGRPACQNPPPACAQSGCCTSCARSR